MATDTTKSEETEEETTSTSTEDTSGLKKALDSERKARRDADKATKALEAKVKQLEDRDKSDGEKLTDRVAQAEARADKAEAMAAKLGVALDKGLTRKQAARLQGSNEEELAADADDLLESFPGKGKASTESETDEGANKGGQGRPPSAKPTADLRGGGDPTQEPDDMDPAKLAAFIPRP